MLDGQVYLKVFFFSSRRRHTRFDCDWSSDVCSSDLWQLAELPPGMAGVSTETAGAILLADSLEQACEFINRFAPEHLSLPESAERLLQKTRSAGNIFFGALGGQPRGG